MTISLFGYLQAAVIGLIVITVHGFLTAFFSHIQGDSTPKDSGMLTLNPVRHFEPIGYILYVVFGFGWGQPIRTSSFAYKNRKLGGIITAVAPVVCGVAYGVVLMLASYGLSSGFHGSLGSAAAFLNALGFKAVLFAIYNLIPVYPLNGHKLLLAVLSPNSAMQYNRMEKILQLVLVLCIFMGVISRIFGMLLTLVGFLA